MKVIAKVKIGNCPESCSPSDFTSQGKCSKVGCKIPTHYNGKKLSEKVINEILAIEKCFEHSIDYIELRMHPDSYYFKLASWYNTYGSNDFDELSKHMAYTWCIFANDKEIYITPRHNRIKELFQTK